SRGKQPVEKAGPRLERMAEGVTQVEQRAFAAFALVASNDLRFHATARCNGVLACRATRKYIVPIGLEPSEETCIAKQSVFRDFCVPGTEFAHAQRVEQRRVGDDQNRLIKGADQVLAEAGSECGAGAR